MTQPHKLSQILQYNHPSPALSRAFLRSPESSGEFLPDLSRVLWSALEMGPLIGSLRRTWEKNRISLRSLSLITNFNTEVKELSGPPNFQYRGLKTGCIHITLLTTALMTDNTYIMWNCGSGKHFHFNTCITGGTRPSRRSVSTTNMFRSLGMRVCRVRMLIKYAQH